MLLNIARRCNVTIRNWNPIEQIDRRAISKEIQINDFPPPTLREEQKKKQKSRYFRFREKFGRLFDAF